MLKSIMSYVNRGKLNKSSYIEDVPMTDNKAKVEEFKTELDIVIVSLNQMAMIWMDLTNEDEDAQLEVNFPFPYSLQEQIADIEEWRNSIDNIK